MTAEAALGGGETVAIFGASGRTGVLVANRALDKGMPVRALCRTAEAASRVPAGVRVSLGPFDGGGTIDAVLQGAGGVICALGPRPPYTNAFCAGATRALLAGMEREGVDRLVCVTGTMIGDYAHRSLFMRLMAAMFSRFQPAVAADRADQERLVMESDRVWTIVKPPRLTDGPAQGNVRWAPDLAVSAGSRISRADLARFLVGELTECRAPRQRIVVRY